VSRNQFSTKITSDFLHITLDGAGTILVWTWLPFRRWRIRSAKRKLLKLKADRQYAEESK
jgi:hypothetical protein